MQPAPPGRGRLQRLRVARVGGREVALLDVRVPGETLHVVCAAGLGVGTVGADRLEGLRGALRAGSPSPTQARWRARLDGAAVRLAETAVELVREGHTVRASTGRGDTIVESDEALADADEATRESLGERGAAIVDTLVTAGTGHRRDALKRALAKAIARVDRRVAAVEGDLARTETADALAQRAQLFVAAAAAAPAGAARLEAVDWTTGEARTVELAIDPARAAKTQVDAMFKRARRLKEGARIGRTRLGEAQAALAVLRAALGNLADADADLSAIEGRARAAAPRDFALAPDEATGAARAPRRGPGAGARGKPASPRLPFRTFLGASGAKILVGRGAADNDDLTFHVGRAHDLWLHAKDRNGAHVIVPLGKGASCPADVLVEAAHLAAHFSDAKGERVADVQYTPRRYLRKPRGSAPGQVMVDREKVMVLRFDDAILKRLLDTEPAAPAR
jgi:NFACT protein RNA binding domain/NFACT N-terminal and middle domains